ncbi:MAG: hypothetical protein PHV74_01700 [Dehalococcoidia bacterium]|nr:hypothetical protein [Dehalococcoidia bacterium]
MRKLGKFNESKAKTLLVVKENETSNLRRYPWGDKKVNVLTIDDVHELSGVSIQTLRKLMPRWHNWGLLARIPVAATQQPRGRVKTCRCFRERPVWGYFSTKKGSSWLEFYARDYLDVRRFEAEIKDWRDLETERLKAALLPANPGNDSNRKA